MTNPPDDAQQLVVDPRPSQTEVDADTSRRPLADRFRHRVCLLVDLLEHERLVSLLLGGVRIPIDLDDLAVDRRAIRREELHPVGCEHHDLVVVDVLHVAGLAQERRDRRADELLAFSPADDQRALLARAYQHAWFASAHRDERIVTAQFAERRTHRVDEAALRVVV